MWARVSLVFFYCFFLYRKKKACSMREETTLVLGTGCRRFFFLFCSSNMRLLKGTSVKMNMLPIFTGLRAISPSLSPAPPQPWGAAPTGSSNSGADNWLSLLFPSQRRHWIPFPHACLQITWLYGLRTVSTAITRTKGITWYISLLKAGN